MEKTIFNGIVILVVVFLAAACSPAVPQSPTALPTTPPYPADPVSMRQMEVITEGNQTVSARPEKTFVLIGFEVAECDRMVSFFFGVGPDGYIVNKDFSDMILTDVFCDKVEKLWMEDAAGNEYPPLGFVSGSTIIFEVDKLAEDLTLRMNEDIRIALFGSPETRDIEPSIIIPYCDEAIASGEIKGDSYLCMVSDPGDYVGDGRTWIFTSEDSTFNTIGPGPMTIFVNDGDWSLDFLPAVEHPNSPGLYEDAIRSMAALQQGKKNGLDVSGDGRGCNQMTGKFEILDMSWRADNTMTRLYVNFEQHCEGEAPALFGYLRFIATDGP